MKKDRTEMTMTLWKSNSLADLASKIRAAHNGVSMLLTRSVERACEAGDLLIEAKQQLDHGQWLPWLAESVETCAWREIATRLKQIGHPCPI
jgi:hypothetical protein